MTHLFSRLSFEVPFSGAQFLNESEVSRVIPLDIPAQDGMVNWFFGSSAASLTSYDGAHVLTDVESTVANTWGVNAVVLPTGADGIANGLRSEYADSNTHTYCAVVEKDSLVSKIIMGALTTSQGEGVMVNGSGALVHIAGGSSVAIPVPDNLVTGDNIFIALTRSGSTVIAYVGGAATKLTRTGAKSLNTSLLVGPGNTSFTTTGSLSKQTKIYEFLYAARAMTEAELNQLYVNAKARCAVRGITIR